MRKIFRIYTTDLKRIMTNWAALVIILALVALPSFYAWFNIKASWDPYGNTKGIPVAVTSHDQGYTVKGDNINVGKMMIKSLKANQKLGWIFVSEKEALDGVKHGDYYASIIIPEDFSEKIASILKENPEKPIITYTVNEKVNAIAPKITSTGASGIVQEISSSFVKTVGETVFSIFNQLGIELERDLPSIESMKRLIFKIEEEMPKLNRIIDTAMVDVNKAQAMVYKVQKNIPIVENVAENGIEFSNHLTDFLNKSEDVLKKVTPAIKENLVLLEQTSYAITNKYQESTIDQSDIQTINSQLLMGTDILNNLKEITGITIPEIDTIKNNFQEQININNQSLAAMNRGETPSQAKIYDLSKQSEDKLSNIVSEFDTSIAPNIDASMDKTRNTVLSVQKILQNVQSSLPDTKKIINNADKGIVIGEQKIKNIKRELPATEAKIKEIANRIREFDTKEDINDLIEFLKHDVQKESDFLKEPVLLKEKKLYPIPNYGSAMSPFFSTLSLWVGAMLLISLLTVEIEEENQYQSYQIYFGRMLIFTTLALLQSLVVTIGDIYLLHTYVADRLWFILFGLFNSAVFVMIVYTLVSVFGNAGKALGIILLVLQISGSGGTFPIQVAPPFFQRINPFLPFTYSISMMREATGGIIWDIVQVDVLVLCGFLIMAFLFGVTCKAKINKLSTELVRKVKDSKLIH